jgi:hypothetical protein
MGRLIIRESGLIPRRTFGSRLPRLKQCNARKNLVLNQPYCRFPIRTCSPLRQCDAKDTAPDICPRSAAGRFIAAHISGRLYGKVAGGIFLRQSNFDTLYNPFILSYGYLFYDIGDVLWKKFLSEFLGQQAWSGKTT